MTLPTIKIQDQSDIENIFTTMKTVYRAEDVEEKKIVEMWLFAADFINVWKNELRVGDSGEILYFINGRFVVTSNTSKL